MKLIGIYIDQQNNDTESINFRYVVFLSHQACWMGGIK